LRSRAADPVAVSYATVPRQAYLSLAFVEHGDGELRRGSGRLQ
jgi:hypothetical protein